MFNSTEPLDYSSPFADDLPDGPGTLSRSELAALEFDRSFTVMPVEACPRCDELLDEDGNCGCTAFSPVLDLLTSIEEAHPRETLSEWQARIRNGWTAARA